MARTRAQNKADELTRLVREYVDAKDRNEVQCPREKTWMTPCIARDGRLALADDGVCVGCGADPAPLVDDLKDRMQAKGSTRH